MENFHLQWILHKLTDDLRQRDVAICDELLPMLEAQEKKQFFDLVTADESWFLLEYKNETQWCVSRQEIAMNVRSRIQTRKFMFIVVWGTTRFCVMNLLKSQCSFDRRLMVQIDNCRVFFKMLTNVFR
jgi:hypothetical protein